MQKNYQIVVDGVGAFEVRRHTMITHAKIGSEFNRLTEGQSEVSNFFGRFCMVFSTLKSLLVSAPTGWDLEALDPTDPDAFDQMYRLFDQIMEKEKFFRSGGQQDGQEAGAGSSQKS